MAKSRQLDTAAAADAARDVADAKEFGRPQRGWRQSLYTVIFESDTRAGRLFDIVLIGAILASVGVVLVDSVVSVRNRYERVLDVAEWTFTLLFTVEYVLRLACVRKPLSYATSFFGVIDLLAILPSYFVLLVPEAHALIDIRILRLVRIFRIFKLVIYFGEFRALGDAIAASRRKIMIFLFVVSMIVLLMGTLMYVIEGPDHGFTSIPMAVYWAIVTMTTVGYGDLTPKTDIGRLLASMMMLLGWGIIAVPTGIITSEMTARRFRPPQARRCPSCLSEGHEPDAEYCKDCGAKLSD